MKIHFSLFLLLITLFFFSCKENSSKQKSVTIEESIQIKEPKEILQDSMVQNSDLKEKEEQPQKHHKIKYSTAKMGLTYRDQPNGKILGKFPLNTALKIVENPKTTDAAPSTNIGDTEKWTGVLNKSETVYVRRDSLSDEYVQSDLNLYVTFPYYKEANGTVRTSFLDMSDTFFEHYYDEIDPNKRILLTENNLKKDTVRLNHEQRNILMDSLKISESDKVFIYEVEKDRVLTYNIKDLPAIACINIYSFSTQEQLNREENYEFGFDLGKKITDWNNFTYVGKENPFLTGKVQPIIWNKIENNEFPTNEKYKENDESKSSYKFSNFEFDYFIQKKSSSYHLIIIDKSSKTEIHNKYYSENEGTYLVPLNIEGIENNAKEPLQWTGKLFKDKDPIIFGLLSHSFGCPALTVLSKTELDIIIQCDNRH